MRFDRERYLALMTGADVSRPMFTELFGPLVGLPEQWRAQGASEAEIDLSAFDWDWVDRAGCGGFCGPMKGPNVVIEDTPTMRVERDGFGRTLRLDKRTATIALPSDFPVTTMDDWLRLKAMFVYEDDRVRPELVAEAKRRRTEGAMIGASIPGAYDMLRELMGEENACVAYYEQPELVRDVMDTLRDTALRVLERVLAEVKIDRLAVHEDFAGRSGPMVGPSQIRDFIQPYYRAVWDLVQSHGATLFGIDSDGNINAIVDDLRACGINELFPMEPAAGMDMVQTRLAHGAELKLRGGIDKFVVRNGTQADIRRELEYKLQPSMRTGGVVFALDHRIPDGTPIENYRCYADLGREILGLPPRPAEPTAFHRSA